MKKVTAIFDIGKTNKKFFLFDQDLTEVYRDYKIFDEIEDEDGHPCDDLFAIRNWAKTSFNKVMQSEEFDVQSLNFSTYGASLVHLDNNGKSITPLYNYTKNIDQSYIDQLYTRHGGIEELSRETASPPSGMLNSGIQMYWIKYHRPDIYHRIKHSLHLPQYMSYLFTGIPVSDYTSIGCHTMLWDHKNDRYHKWVTAEGIDKKLAPIVNTNKLFNIEHDGKRIKIGTGIHDSSSSLVPYIKGSSDPFILISTGTWSVTLNPFNKQEIKQSDLENNCLNYMSIDGQRVRASRVFLGNEYNNQVKLLNTYFEKPPEYHKSIEFLENIYLIIRKENKKYFHFSSIDSKRNQPTQTSYNSFLNFEYAYHQLMYELMELQIQASELSLGNTTIKKVYIDGGFAENELFVKLVSTHFKNYEVLTAKASNGSALGAALMVNEGIGGKDILVEKYNLQEWKDLKD